MSDNNISLKVGVLPEPLVCLPGEDRPHNTPKYIGEETCDADMAQEGLRLAAQRYQQICPSHKYNIPRGERSLGLYETSSWWHNFYTPELEFKSSPNFQFTGIDEEVVGIDPASTFSDKGRERSNWCSTLFSDKQITQMPIIDVVKEFDFLDENLPNFMDIVFSLNVDQYHDFRSWKSFDEATSLMEDQMLILNGDRELNVVYPAAGSHMTALLVGLNMADHNVIDSAEYTYTEIDPKATERVRTYLEFYTRGEEPVFSDFKEETQEFSDEGYEAKFTWNYKNTPFTFTMAINRSGEEYVREEYLNAANLLIMHDSVGTKLEPEFIKQFTALSAKDGKNRWALATAVASNRPKERSYSVRGEEKPKVDWELPVYEGAHTLPLNISFGYGCGKSVGNAPISNVYSVSETGEMILAGNRNEPFGNDPFDLVTYDEDGNEVGNRMPTHFTADTWSESDGMGGGMLISIPGVK